MRITSLALTVLLATILMVATTSQVEAGIADDPSGPNCVLTTEGAIDLPDACEVPGTPVTFDTASIDPIAATVPPANTTVVVDAMADDESTVSLTVSTDEAGNVSATPESSAADDSGDPRNGPARCSDGAYNLTTYTWPDGHTSHAKWYAAIHWYFKAGSNPSGLTQAQAIDGISTGMAGPPHARTDCTGLGDQVDATQIYEGTSQKSPDFKSGTNVCTDSDGVNVIGFGDLGDNKYLATTCTWIQNHAGRDEIIGADVKFDTTGHTWYVPGDTSCSKDWSVTAVATHEAGHVFGLNHVSESEHGYLTMSPAINGTCQNSEATLGRGDVLGMEDLY